nr:unnamed protein product [Callosobruchus analis]
MASKYVIKLHDIMMFFKDEEKLISKGENAVESGHVTSLISDADLHLIRGKVHASMKDREYNVEVEFNSEWVIKSATCNCPRGQLRCHHMAALIVFARDNISVTDKGCMWSKPKQLRDPDVKKLSDLYPPKDHRSTARDLTDEEIEQFKHKLSVFDGSVGFSWLLSEESNQEGNSESPSIVDIESLIFHEDYVTSANKLRYFEDHRKVDDEYVKQIAQQTIGQQPISHNKKKNAHLVIWTPKEVAIVNIEAECFNEHLNVLKMFYFEHYIPFLLREKHM